MSPIVGTQLELHLDCEHKRWLVRVRIEGITGKVQSLERDARDQAALNVAIGFVRASPLRHQAKPKPIHRHQSQFRPVVEKTVLMITRVRDVLIFAVEFELPPGQ